MIPVMYPTSMGATAITPFDPSFYAASQYSSGDPSLMLSFYQQQNQFLFHKCVELQQVIFNISSTMPPQYPEVAPHPMLTPPPHHHIPEDPPPPATTPAPTPTPFLCPDCPTKEEQLSLLHASAAQLKKDGEAREAQLRAQVEQLESQVKQLSSRVKILNSDVSSKEAERLQEHQMWLRTRDELLAMQEEAQRLSKVATRQEGDFLRREQGYKGEIRGLQEKYKESQGQNQELLDMLDQLKAAANNAGSSTGAPQAAELSTSTQSLKDKLKSLQDRYTKLQTQYKDMETLYRDTEKMVKLHQDVATETEKRYAEKFKAAERHHADASQLYTDLKKQFNRLADLYNAHMAEDAEFWASEAAKPNVCMDASSMQKIVNETRILSDDLDPDLCPLRCTNRDLRHRLVFFLCTRELGMKFLAAFQMRHRTEMEESAAVLEAFRQGVLNDHPSISHLTDALEECRRAEFALLSKRIDNLEAMVNDEISHYAGILYKQQTKLFQLYFKYFRGVSNNPQEPEHHQFEKLWSFVFGEHRGKLLRQQLNESTTQLEAQLPHWLEVSEFLDRAIQKKDGDQIVHTEVIQVVYEPAKKILVYENPQLPTVPSSTSNSQTSNSQTVQLPPLHLNMSLKTPGEPGVGQGKKQHKKQEQEEEQRESVVPSTVPDEQPPKTLQQIMGNAVSKVINSSMGPAMGTALGIAAASAALQICGSDRQQGKKEEEESRETKAEDEQVLNEIRHETLQRFVAHLAPNKAAINKKPKKKKNSGGSKKKEELPAKKRLDNKGGSSSPPEEGFTPEQLKHLQKAVETAKQVVQERQMKEMIGVVEDLRKFEQLYDNDEEE